MKKELLLRVASGAIGIPLALFLIYQGGALFGLTILLIALRGVHEFVATFRAKQVEIIKEAAYPAVAVVVAAPLVLSLQDLGLLYATVLFVLIAGSLAYHVCVPPKDNPSPDPRFQYGVALSAGATILAALYVSLFAFLILLRNLNEPATRDALANWEPGARLMLLTLLATWSVDAGAYFIGRAIGRHKLAPRVSPGKTVEGALGGWCVGVVVTILVSIWLGFSLKHGVILGVIMGFAGQLGDLCKSVIKRDVGVKDFPSLIPGHGGIIDRFDSLLFNVPMVYVYAVSWMH